MPEFTKPVPGAFCWIELATTDRDAAKKFYGSLFGWSTEDMPSQGGPPYAIADIGGKLVGGITLLQEEAKKMGAPPHWLSYVAVEDAEVAAQKVTSLGGKVLVGPMNIGQGVMVVAQDPAGAVFAVWQQLQSMGTFLSGEPGSLGWNELATTDVDRAGKFYVNLFGWKADAQQMPGMVYTVFKNQDVMAGGMMAQPKEMAGAPPAWTVYFSVADADVTMAKAVSLGGKALTPVMDIPDVGRFGVVMDPEGAAFAIIKFVPMPK